MNVIIKNVPVLPKVRILDIMRPSPLFKNTLKNISENIL